VEKLATFSYVVGIFLPRNFLLISEKLNCSANESKTPLLSNLSLEGRCWRCYPGEWGVEVQRGRFGEECGV